MSVVTSARRAAIRAGHSPPVAEGDQSGAFRVLVRQPPGFLLVTVAIGLAVFGGYCFGQARYRKV